MKKTGTVRTQRKRMSHGLTALLFWILDVLTSDKSENAFQLFHLHTESKDYNDDCLI